MYSAKEQNFLKNPIGLGVVFIKRAQKFTEQKTTQQGEQLNASPFLHRICPCLPLCGAGGVVSGRGSLERICPDFGRRKKEGVWSKYL